MKHPQELGFVREVKPAFEHMPITRRHITIPPWDQLPRDVLDLISQKLDFDDLFQFSRVCKDWRLVFHESTDKSKFLTSQEPLLLEFFNYPVKVPYSFTSLPTQKVYPLKKMMMNHLLSYSDNSFPIYVTYSSGYFIMIADNSSILLVNPFTRIKKKVICPSTFEFSSSAQHTYRALLAFDKCSEEFVLLFLFRLSNGLHVYQSRNNGWVTYSTEDNEDAVVDFVALNNKIYVVTEEPKIGVLSLDSPNIEYLPMVNSPNLNIVLSFFNLVKCDEQLLLVRLNPSLHPIIMRGDPPPERKVYKIDFSTMTYVELETLGDIALFYVAFRSCKALINPNKWGYESNSVYEVYNCAHKCPRIKNPFCTVYNWDKKSEKSIAPPNPRTAGSVFDWCFRHPEI
ncbi:uncharacterized protein LOC131599850 [Vicia villosa]|uniref:uncharacterized protein LOC131599850 n=1 Tax=Vicia villosa TaxID=3911 RepID=UPI00273BB11A|nr:uncharacterized protein LOC131599850 [Vicia villosa]